MRLSLTKPYLSPTFLTLYKLYQNPQKVFNNYFNFEYDLNWGHAFRVKILQENKIQLVLTNTFHIPLKKLCKFQVSVLRSVFSFLNKSCHVQEVECICDGDEHCKYEIES